MINITLIITAAILTLVLSSIMIALALRDSPRDYIEKANEKYKVSSSIDLNTLIWSNGYNRIDFGDGNVLIGNSDEYSSNPTNYDSKYACDSTYPDDYEPDIIKGFYDSYPGTIYVSNLNRKSLSKSQNARTHPLPVGIDFHTLTNRSLWGESLTGWKEQMNNMVNLRDSAKSIHKRKKRILITWVDPNLQDYSRFEPDYMGRKDIKNILLKTGLCDHIIGSRSELWSKMCEYAFVYSPNGRGFDCHRTWEAIALGCIVIAQENPAIKEFINMFPIAIHKPEIDVIDTKYLDNLLNRYKPAKLLDMTMEKVIKANKQKYD